MTTTTEDTLLHPLTGEELAAIMARLEKQRTFYEQYIRYAPAALAHEMSRCLAAATALQDALVAVEKWQEGQP